MNPYLSIARLDHYSKNAFMIPGSVLALFLTRADIANLTFWFNAIFGFVALCAASSANYVINEYLDRESDKHHPTKYNRPAARGLINPYILLVEYAFLALSAVAISYSLNVYVLAWIASLLLMGCLYNVPPFRLKDVAFLDVIVESVNNPIRFMIGWTLVAESALPPVTALFAYWVGGGVFDDCKKAGGVQELCFDIEPSLIPKII